LRTFSALYYLTGLVEECAELQEARCVETTDTTDAVLEAGDVLWYMTALLHSVGSHLTNALEGPLWNTRPNPGTETAREPLRAIGAIAAAVKKYERGDPTVTYEERRNTVVAAGSHILSWAMAGGSESTHSGITG
jgi:hypothetical protein